MTLDPNEVEQLRAVPAHLSSAQGYYELGMAVESQTALERLPDSDRLNAEAIELETLLLLDQKQWDKAIAVSERAINLHSHMPFGYVNRAYALHEKGETLLALKTLEEAHLTVAVEPAALYNRGCYLACLDRAEEAAFWINKTLRIEPRLVAWAKKDPDLRVIRDRLDLG